MTGVVIRARGLTKVYDRGTKQELCALDAVDFEIRKGEIFGLIGADGAGKSTCFKILAGVLEPTAGEVEVLFRSPRESRQRVGYVTQPFSLYEDLSVAENLRYAAGLREVDEEAFAERSRRYLEAFDMKAFTDRLAGRLSGGMKQKLALSCALIADPAVLLLDEPTTGVDPVSRRDFWDALGGLADRGMTIVVATPYLDEAERCTRIACMENGKILAQYPPAEFVSRMALTRLEIRTCDLQRAEEMLERHERDGILADVQRFGDRLDVLVSDPVADRDRILEALEAEELKPEVLRSGDPTLENAFVATLRSKRGPESHAHFPDRATAPAERCGELALGTKGLVKRFGSFTAVKGLDLEIRHGEIYGLLGANGAGKTTAIKMICGLVQPSSGEISLLGRTKGFRTAAVRSRIGYKSQKFTLYDDLTIGENLDFYAAMYDVPPKLCRARKDWALEVSGLRGEEGMLTGRLPDGWKQRVAFGAAVMHQPDIVFLDEPTSGVDALARRAMWRMINELADNGAAVLVVTHYLEEAEQCNRIGFMAAGDMVAEGSPSELEKHMPGVLLEVRAANVAASLGAFRQALGRDRVTQFGERLHVQAPDVGAGEREIQAIAEAQSLELRSIEPIPFSLEDVFLALIERRRAASDKAA
ncbi:MAG: ATP-binding cassette domain-containing protein [Acidobacteria bacterium]|nr:ATP-binding cassette domain-containing protein [Acidobacteriota bacterium]